MSRFLLARRRRACALARAAVLFPVSIFSLTSALADEAPQLAASVASGSVDGHVTDSGGAPLPAARLRLLNAAGREVAHTTTDDRGDFTIVGIAAGHYAIEARNGGDEASVLVEVGAGAVSHAALRLGAIELDAVTVTAKRFERARNALSPATGSSQYLFDQQALEDLPQGEHTPLNEVLLQAPGVAGDSYGQIHVRGDHADLQYRINGVILPEGVATFGQTFDTRFIDKLDLLTGALPAQYGYRTAGVVDLTTKQNVNGGVLDLYGGSHGTINPSAQYGYTNSGFSAFGSASYLSSSLGLEPPTTGANPIRDRTTQGRGFAFLSDVLSDRLKVSGIFGAAVNRFEIPNHPGQVPDSGYLSALGLSGFDSAALDERQYERNQYGIVALQGVESSGLNWQLAASTRQSAVEFAPDVLGDLAFNGDASKIKRKSLAYGLQGDASVPIAEHHTLRAGFSATLENDRADNASTVFPTTAPQADGSCPAGTTAGDSGQCLSGGPTTIVDNNPKNGNTLYGVYLQDQWDLGEAVTLNYGLRYDRLHAFVSASQLSPRIGAIWHATGSTTLHAGYARYFTPPVNELIANTSIAKFNDTSNAFEVQQNSPVQPERQHYFDVGVVQQLLPGLTIGLDGYYKYIRELQDEGQFGQALIFAPFNYQQGHVAGIELSSAWHRGPLSAYLNIARSRANATRVASGEFNFGPDDLAYIASHYIYLDHDQSLSISSGANLDWHDTTFGVAMTYGSGLRKDAVDADGNTLIPNGAKVRPNLRVDLSVQQALHLGATLGDLNLRLAALNVLDRTNIVRDGTGIGVSAAQYSPRAAVYFGVSKPFGGT